MAAISVEKYQTIANLYSQAQQQLVGITSYYYDAAYEVVLLQAFDPEIDLLVPFVNAYTGSQTTYLQPTPAVVNAVVQLQRHILSKARDDTTDHSRFSTINDWLDANATNGYRTTAIGRQNDVDTSIKVSEEFAALSSLAGFDIDSDNIL